SRTRPSLTDALLLVGFGGLALAHQRDVIWFGMLAAPVLAQCLAGITLPSRSGSNQPARRANAPNTAGRRARRRSASIRPSPAPQPVAQSARPALRSRGAAVARMVLALVLLLAFIAVQPPLSLRLPIPGRAAQDYAAVPSAPRLFARETP